MFEDCTSLAKLSIGEKTVNIKLPVYKVNNHTDWYSPGTKSGFTAAQIHDSRQGIADTYTKSEFLPVIADGDNQIWKPGSASGATFRSTAALADFLRVIVDGVVVDRANYDLSEGSTVVTLKPAFLSALIPGDHEIKIVSTTGTAKASFATEKASEANDPKPDDGDKPGADEPGTVATETMYRLYNPNSGEHFYTASTIERDSVIAAGWNDEGIGWTAPTQGIQVYRLYNAYAGEHHYTTSVEERDMLVDAGWTWEEGGWFSDPDKAVPLYRAYNPNEYANNHHYTLDRGEFEILLGLGWQDEGVGWYGVR